MTRNINEPTYSCTCSQMGASFCGPKQGDVISHNHIRAPATTHDNIMLSEGSTAQVFLQLWLGGWHALATTGCQVWDSRPAL